MSLDGLVTRAIASELAMCEGGRINKINQPSRSDIVLQIRARGQNLKLLLSAGATYPRVHLTEAQYVNPTEAPMFCMLLRKHCEGGVIEKVAQVGLERVLHIDVRQRDEIGDISLKRIVVEIMGRHSNIILLDPASGTILDGIHHVTPAISNYRIVMPGSSYTSPPEQGKANPLEMTEATFMDAVNKPDEAGTLTRQRLVDCFSGVSPLAAREIVFRSGIPATALALETDWSAVWNVFREVMQDVGAGRFTPVIADETGSGKAYFSVIELTHVEGTSSRFDSVSACLESYYGDKAVRDTVKQRASDMIRFLQNERNKNAKKLEKLDETIEEAKGADEYRILGELLTASLHTIRKGDKSIEVINYYDEEQKPLRIELDPLLSPSENAQRYFKKYTKLRNSLEAVNEQIESARKEIIYFDTLLTQLDRAALVDIEGIREELIEQGYLRERGGKKNVKKKKNDKPVLTCYTSGEGVPIYVGKNNIQNEYLTNRVAQPNDTWLHTKDIPGSHVVIRADKFGEATLHEAAMLAAYYSQAKSSSQVPVDYTLIRHVRKPNGAKPGFVIYERQKTLYMTPDEDAIKTLPVTVK
ncbi:Rqc2 family fibronectin-binding protein [Paenibacillus ginsengarvi]|uniref:Rqc2 homolog RqcH n=1 Tax=Paenibacillus ginsengarvi TaxID=400777 RepID=A0A3B0CPV8_9BACL|nr:NFACT RNA binding domain-containing protein [Paenibacillus ginsengarvi]RKN86640.1 fibronectin/fibrinogen-binding protein [Paenibacillus ginsengarvi]